MDDIDDVCPLCDLPMHLDSSMTVMKPTIDSFSRASVQRKDRKHLMFRHYSALTIHKSCRVTYVRQRSIDAAIKKAAAENMDAESVPGSSRATRASGEQKFAYNFRCLFCGEDASDDFIESQKAVVQEKRTVVKLVSHDTTRTTILELCKERNDAMRDEVYERVSVEPDLPGVGARYHSHCFAKFNFWRPTSTMGRPISTDIGHVVEFVIEYLLNTTDDCQHTLSDILSTYTAKHDTTYKYIVEKLQAHFHNQLIIQPIKNDYYLCFRNVGEKILSKQFYTKQRRNNDVDERNRIVEAAATIIWKDIRSRVYDTEHYKAPTCLLVDADSDIPETLKLFLSTLILKKKKGS